MKYITQEPDLIMSTSLILYIDEIENIAALFLPFLFYMVSAAETGL